MKNSSVTSVVCHLKMADTGMREGHNAPMHLIEAEEKVLRKKL
jgi:hypothetical protein